MKEICIISSCDEWHSYSSMRVICVVDREHLDQALRKIKKKYKYNEEDMNDYINLDWHYLNDLEEI